MTEQEQWGLEALSAAYEARKNLESGQPVDETLPPIMRSAIFFGQDLSALGMDLDSIDPIYPTFTPFPAANSTGSTFDFHDRHTIPDFQLPGAYTVNNVPPLAGRVAALSDGKSYHGRSTLLKLTLRQKPSSAYSTKCPTTSCRNWQRKSSQHETGAGTNYSDNGCRKTPVKQTPTPACRSSTSRTVRP
jgi:hypothetical protein